MQWEAHVEMWVRLSSIYALNWRTLHCHSAFTAILLSSNRKITGLQRLLDKLQPLLMAHGHTDKTAALGSIGWIHKGNIGSFMGPNTSLIRKKESFTFAWVSFQFISISSFSWTITAWFACPDIASLAKWINLITGFDLTEASMKPDLTACHRKDSIRQDNNLS